MKKYIVLMFFALISQIQAWDSLDVVTTAIAIKQGFAKQSSEQNWAVMSLVGSFDSAVTEGVNASIYAILLAPECISRDVADFYYIGKDFFTFFLGKRRSRPVESVKSSEKDENLSVNPEKAAHKTQEKMEKVQDPTKSNLESDSLTHNSGATDELSIKGREITSAKSVGKTKNQWSTVQQGQYVRRSGLDNFVNNR